MKFVEKRDGIWKAWELVTGFIEAHSGRRFGEPTLTSMRIPTYIACGAFLNEEWDCYGITREQAFAAYCFEAGREFQKQRTLKKQIDEAVEAGWAEVNKQKDKANG